MTSSSGQRRVRRGDPHGWNALGNYLKVHHSYLDMFRENLVLGDSLQYEFPSPDVFEIRGRVACQHDLFVDVDKTLEVNERNQVRTIKYSYHAGVEGRRTRSVFRYDNAHRYTREGHADEHHKHRFDPATWQEIEPPIWIGRDSWPHLSEVLEELQHWWATIGCRLDLPRELSDMTELQEDMPRDD